MNLSREGFFCKVESLVSTLCEVIWWAAIFQFPMHDPKEVPTHQVEGLKALMDNSEKESLPKLDGRTVHSYSISSASTSSVSLSKSSSWSLSTSCNSSLHSLPRFLSYPSSVMGDLIGTESGVYMSSYEDLVTESHRNGRQNKGSQEPATKTNYPPPIPLLAGTGNLVAHMPWVLTRRCTSDGKLILTEERGKYQEYFEAKREHGRLLLSLVSLGDNDDKVKQMEETEKEEEEDLYFMEGINGASSSEKDTETEMVEFDIYDNDSCDDEEKGKQPTRTMLASSMPEIPPVNMIREKSLFGRRCLTFVGRGSSDSSNMLHPNVNNIIYT